MNLKFDKHTGCYVKNNKSIVLPTEPAKTGQCLSTQNMHPNQSYNFSKFQINSFLYKKMTGWLVIVVVKIHKTKYEVKRGPNGIIFNVSNKT